MIPTSRRSLLLLLVACLAPGDTVAGQGADLPAGVPAAVVGQPAPAPVASHPSSSSRLTASLFAGFVATQALDVHSTLRAIDGGAREMNGMVRWATARPATYIGIKAATTTATCLLVDRVRRKHPVRARLILIGLDAAYAAIVAHNYTVRR